MPGKTSQEKATTDWLMESVVPEIRLLTARDILSAGTAKVRILEKESVTAGGVSKILSRMRGEGYWVKPGAGYSPKYKGTVWSLIALAQMGARAATDPRLGKACGYLLDHALTAGGQFSCNGQPSATIPCLQGNLCAALLDMGVTDPRLNPAFEWMARSVTGEGVASREDQHAPVRYYAYHRGPGFLCGPNEGPCAWGAVKIMSAFARLPRSKWNRLVENAVQAGVDFLFGIDPLTAAYHCPQGQKPSRNWWKFGFPVFYVTDLLQLADALVRLGFGRDRRLRPTLEFIRSKRDEDGRWAMEYDYTGKTWLDYGAKRQPNPWVTYRAASVLRAADA